MKSKFFWVPNALSLGNLTFGFVSILISTAAVYGSPNNLDLFITSGVFIMLAAIFDGFDGMVARALDATSEMGAELDSLADLTTFGIAPGFLMFQMVLSEYKMDLIGDGKLFPYGMMIAAIYPICAAYRLARFNVEHDPSSFTGLPSPVAGVFVALFPIAFGTMNVSHYISISGFVVVAMLMVSTIKYSKPQAAMRGKYSKDKIIMALIGFAVVLFIVGLKNIPIVLYGLVIFYVFSGIISLIIHFIQESKL